MHEDDDEKSEIALEFALALMTYTWAQGTTEDRDQAQMGQPPYPVQDNVMLKYLIQRATEMTGCTGPDRILARAVVWLAAHAWFEGGLDERSRTRGHRPVTDDDAERAKSLFLGFLDHTIDPQDLTRDPDLARRALIALQPERPPSEPTPSTVELIAQQRAMWLKRFQATQSLP
jgi:hypothetical protein